MSYSYRGRGGSRATPSTVCQKCLQKGHYSYECKSGIQERPYQSRPSRSQQLLNPRLRQTLTNLTPSEPQPTKGLADAILEQSAKARHPKRTLDTAEDSAPPRKRSRSVSSQSSYDSVSTISTNRSRSPMDAPDPPGISRRSSGTKRRRSRSPSTSWETAAEPKGAAERHTRHRRRSSSPRQRGRRQERSPSLDKATFSHSHTQSLSRSRDAMDIERRGEGGYRGMRNGERDRERSMSPYSKRISMTRGSGI